MNKWFLIGGFLIVAFIHTRDNLPRGIRNNNPLNIRENSRVDFAWQGESVLDTDSEFEVFESAEHGFRAAKRIIDSYRRRGLVTLDQIISTWAPSNENNTESYIQSVSRNTGLARGQRVTDGDLVDLFAAMTLHENGQQPYQQSTIKRGIDLA